MLCTVSALTQSSLWLLNFALDSMVLPCPLNVAVAVAVGERLGGETVPGAAQLLSPPWKLVLGSCVGSWEGGRGKGSGGGGDSGVPGPDPFPLHGGTF